jgi:outer membrane protein assembly factor BamB
MKTSPLAIGAIATLCLSLHSVADDWMQWRGPNFNGSSAEKNLPSTFTRESGVAWSLKLNGPSASTPVVYENKIFLSSVDAENQSTHAICVDRLSGKIVWENKVSDGIKRDDRSNFSSPSPATDGTRVVFLYGNGVVSAFDLNGKLQWSRNLEEDFGAFAYQWTYSASPLIFDGKLYIQVLQRNEPVHERGKPNGESFILCADPATGKTLWKHVRQTEAQAESREAFSTPIPHQINGKWQILIVGGDMVSGHNPDTGAELWRWGTWNPTRIGHWRLVPSPVAGAGVVLACAPKKAPVYAVKPGNGTLDEKALAWASTERAITSDVPTPAFYDGDFFVLSDVAKALSRVAPDGSIKWSIETPGKIKYEASPTACDGKIYIVNFTGEVVVVSAADGKILHQAPFGTPEDKQIRSAIVPTHGQLLLRTDTQLFCIGKR